MFNKSDYTFLTDSLTNVNGYPNGYKYIIDHIMVTNSSMSYYGTEGVAKILTLDQEYGKYESEISDHRPVVAIFKGFSLQ